MACRPYNTGRCLQLRLFNCPNFGVHFKTVPMILDYVDSISFAFDKNRYYEGSPNPRLKKLRQGKCRVNSK